MAMGISDLQNSLPYFAVKNKINMVHCSTSEHHYNFLSNHYNTDYIMIITLII